MQNTQLIRYITANFASLRGLRRLPFGIYYLLGVVANGWIIPYGFDTPTFFMVSIALFIVALMLTFGMDIYYTHNFGDVLAPLVSPKKVLPFSRVWLWVPVVVGVLFIMSLDTKQQLPDAMHWIIFVGYPVLMIGSFALQWRKRDAYGPVPLWPIVVMALFYVMVPGVRNYTSQPGLNNSALQNWIVAVFLIGSGVYNHLQMTRGLRRVSEEIHGSTTI